MPKYHLVEIACKHCWGNNFMDVFRDFMTQNCDSFINAPQTPAEEQNLEYYELFQKYLHLYETILSNYISSLDCSIEDFYDQLADIKADSNIKDKKLVYFVNYLIACTDYPSFYKLMVRAAKKKAKGDAELIDVDQSSTTTPAKAEAKNDAKALPINSGSKTLPNHQNNVNDAKLYSPDSKESK